MEAKGPRQQSGGCRGSSVLPEGSSFSSGQVHTRILPLLTVWLLSTCLPLCDSICSSTQWAWPLPSRVVARPK